MDIFDKCKAILARLDEADKRAKRKEKKVKIYFTKGGKKV